MDDRKLDSLLKTGKIQADRFFAGWDPQLQPQQLQARHREQKLTKSWLPVWKWKPVFLAVGILLLVCLSVYLPDTTEPSPPVNTTVPSYGFNATGYESYYPIIDLLLAEDFAFQGELVLKDGVLVGEGPGGMVTRIIPYQLNPYGDLVLGADRVLLQVGEELLLVGVNLPYYVELSTGDYYLKKINERGIGYISETRFSVHRPGEDLLQLIPRSDPAKRRTIYVKVIH
ncbi:MAG: hypothetical protein GX750_01565 [Clostridia bacterium]|nr:hypothetical protein [Clostridia bacterium]